MTVEEYFKLNCSQSVGEVVKKLREETNKLMKFSEQNSTRSVAYYEAYKRTEKRFEEELSKHKFPEFEDYVWGYECRFDGFSFSLLLKSYDLIIPETDDIILPSLISTNECFELVKVDCDYLSIYEYAKHYGVEPGTVIQWIRRGKFKAAAKVGNEWLIPELSDIPRRGFTFSHYEIVGKMRPLSDKYSFLDDADSVLILQDEKNKKFFWVDASRMTTDGYLISIFNEKFEKKEKEKFELALIAHPNAKYKINYTEGILDDLIGMNSNNTGEKK